MNSMIRSLERFTRKYENRFENDFARIRNNIDFHIEQLQAVIKEVDSAMDINGDEIANWCEAVEDVYSVDEVSTIWERMELWLLKKYVNAKYAKCLEEAVKLGNIKERLEKMLNRLKVLKCF